jgi:hypothetical protein
MSEMRAFQIANVYEASEYKIIKYLITEHVRSRLGTSIDLRTYHQQLNDSAHLCMAPKTARVLNRRNSEVILALPGTKKLLDSHPGYRFANVVYDSNSSEDRPEFYFRLVRPNQPSDIGTPHCDYWFDQAMGTNYGRNNTIKFWLPIVSDPGKNGLLFYPNAPQETPFVILTKDGCKRPMIDCPLSELGDPVLPQPAYGQAIKFDDEIVHCGALNVGSTTRVSMEITLVKGK